MKIRDFVEQYLKEIGSFPLLCEEEQIALLRKIHTEHNNDAKTLFIQSNLRLVVAPAKRYTKINSKNKFDAELFLELLEEGNIGLIEAINHFKVSKINPETRKPYRFSTYAEWWIKKYILAFIKRQRKSKTDLDIDSLENFDEDHTRCLENLSLEESIETLHLALKRLDPRYEKVLVKKYGLKGKKPMSSQAIGKLLGGVSKQAIQQIEVRALLKLRFKINDLLREKMFRIVFSEP